MGNWLLLLLFVAGLFVAPLLTGVLSLWPPPFNTLQALASLVVCIAGIVWSIRRIRRRVRFTARSWATLGIATTAFTLSLLFNFNYLRSPTGWWISTPLLNAMEAYKADQGGYPETLDLLAPDYLDADDVPETTHKRKLNNHNPVRVAYGGSGDYFALYVWVGGPMKRWCHYRIRDYGYDPGTFQARCENRWCPLCM